jgi:hypothetical protein
MRTLMITLGVIAFFALAMIAVRPLGIKNTRATPAASQPADKDNQQLARLFQEDQTDRAPEENIDWKVVGPRDIARQARVKELCRGGMLNTGADYYHAAMVLQHGEAPEDYLLAHELCVVALAKGNQDARWLAAATEDRFLMSIGRPQRFGTQYQADGPNAEFKLYQMEEGVTDPMRSAMNVPAPK